MRLILTKQAIEENKHGVFVEANLVQQNLIWFARRFRFDSELFPCIVEQFVLVLSVEFFFAFVNAFKEDFFQLCYLLLLACPLVLVSFSFNFDSAKVALLKHNLAVQVFVSSLLKIDKLALQRVDIVFPKFLHDKALDTWFLRLLIQLCKLMLRLR